MREYLDMCGCGGTIFKLMLTDSDPEDVIARWACERCNRPEKMIAWKGPIKEIRSEVAAAGYKLYE